MIKYKKLNMSNVEDTISNTVNPQDYFIAEVVHSINSETSTHIYTINILEKISENHK